MYGKDFGPMSDDLKKPYPNLPEFIEFHVDRESLATLPIRTFAHLKTSLLDASGSWHETATSCHCEFVGEDVQTL